MVCRHSEDLWLRRIYSSWSRRLEDVFWRRRRKASLSRKMFAGNNADLYFVFSQAHLKSESAIGLPGFQWQNCCCVECLQKQTWHKQWDNWICLVENEVVQLDEH